MSIEPPLPRLSSSRIEHAYVVGFEARDAAVVDLREVRAHLVGGQGLLEETVGGFAAGEDAHVGTFTLVTRTGLGDACEGNEGHGQEWKRETEGWIRDFFIRAGQ
ncbi:MAG: hypothetical protein R3F17_10560 [Planctomycetota bacterium]